MKPIDTSGGGLICAGEGAFEGDFCFVSRLILAAPSRPFCMDVLVPVLVELGLTGVAIPFLARTIGVFNENEVPAMLKKCCVSI